MLCVVVQLCPTLCNPMDCIACQSPLSMGFSRQEYWNGLPCPPPGDLPNLGIKPRSPTLQVDSLPSEPPGKLINTGVGSLSVSSWLRNWTGVSCIAGEFFTSWTTREACAREYSPLIYIYTTFRVSLNLVVVEGLLSCWTNCSDNLQWHRRGKHGRPQLPCLLLHGVLFNHSAVFLTKSNGSKEKQNLQIQNLPKSSGCKVAYVLFIMATVSSPLSVISSINSDL